MNNSNRKKIHPGDLQEGELYDVEYYRIENPEYRSIRRFLSYNLKNAYLQEQKWDPNSHPHLTLTFIYYDNNNNEKTYRHVWDPKDKIYPSYSSYTLKDQLKDSKEPNALLALDKATSGTEDLKKYIGEFGGGKRKRTTRKQKGCKKKKSRRKQKGCKKKKSRRSKK
jgi:hypothetical protein